MQLTKFAHSCVRLEGPGGVITIDPGVFSDSAAALAGASALLITHEHPDHADLPAIQAAARAQADLRIWAPAVVAAQLAEFGDRVTTVGPGESFEAAGVAVRTAGGQHALIHSSMPLVANVGYLIGSEGSALYHPGDSLVVPTEAVDTLLAPIAAPWSKAGEVIDFVVAVRPRLAHQIHEAVASAAGLGMVEGMVTRIAAGYGIEFAHLDTGQTV
ncbi:MAG: fold metallo-hydrolase [Pseudonocardiales bacterium]|nr:fold metallo-hydrolase [Pseudonocardiales bacterium]